MTSDTDVAWTVARSVRGDLGAFAELLKQPEAVLGGAEEGAPAHVLGVEAVRRVLREFQDDRASADLVRRWASFMRRGYLEQSHRGPIHRLSIEYDHAADDCITEILARLDSLGDAVDGEIDSDEVGEMLTALAGV